MMYDILCIYTCMHVHTQYMYMYMCMYVYTYMCMHAVYRYM